MAKRRIEPTSIGLQQLGVYAEVDDDTPPPSREHAPVTESDVTILQAWAEGHLSGSFQRIILAVLADRARYQERIVALEEALANWNEHLGGCSAGRSKLPCKCGLVEKRVLLGEVPDEDHR